MGLFPFFLVCLNFFIPSFYRMATHSQNITAALASASNSIAPSTRRSVSISFSPWLFFSLLSFCFVVSTRFAGLVGKITVQIMGWVSGSVHHKILLASCNTSMILPRAWTPSSNRCRPLHTIIAFTGSPVPLNTRSWPSLWRVSNAGRWTVNLVALCRWLLRFFQGSMPISIQVPVFCIFLPLLIWFVTFLFL